MPPVPASPPADAVCGIVDRRTIVDRVFFGLSVCVVDGIYCLYVSIV